MNEKETIQAVKVNGQIALISDDRDIHGVIVTVEELDNMISSGAPLREAFGRFVAHSRYFVPGFDELCFGFDVSFGERVDFDAFDVRDGNDPDVHPVRFTLGEGNDFTV